MHRPGNRESLYNPILEDESLVMGSQRSKPHVEHADEAVAVAGEVSRPEIILKHQVLASHLLHCITKEKFI